MSWNLDSSSLKLGSWVPDRTSRQIFFCHLSLPWLFASVSSLKELGTKPSRVPRTKRYLKRKRSARSRNSESSPLALTWPRGANQRKSRRTSTVSQPLAGRAVPTRSFYPQRWLKAAASICLVSVLTRRQEAALAKRVKRKREREEKWR